MGNERSTGFNPGSTSGGYFTLPESFSSGSGASPSTLPANTFGTVVSGNYRQGYSGDCGGSASRGCGSSYKGCDPSSFMYGTMIGSLMPSSPCGPFSYVRSQTQPWSGGWRSDIQMTKPSHVMTTGIISSSLPSSSSSSSKSSTSSSPTSPSTISSSSPAPVST